MDFVCVSFHFSRLQFNYYVNIGLGLWTLVYMECMTLQQQFTYITLVPLLFMWVEYNAYVFHLVLACVNSTNDLVIPTHISYCARANLRGNICNLGCLQKFLC